MTYRPEAGFAEGGHEAVNHWPPVEGDTEAVGAKYTVELQKRWLKSVSVTPSLGRLLKGSMRRTAHPTLAILNPEISSKLVVLQLPSKWNDLSCSGRLLPFRFECPEPPYEGFVGV